ncbi:hypothetical protein [Hyphomonas sp.]|uniref:hypothetical protein n=1 Tax=Hyphomonas sp. TaxID=87 RepID=UPI00391A3E82
MNRLAAILTVFALGACTAMAGPSGPPPAGPMPVAPSHFRAAPMNAPAGETCPAGPQEADCLLEAAWAAAETLGSAKLQRLRPAFAEAVAQSPDPALKARWRTRLGRAVPPAPPVNYARETAEAAIAAHGWVGFLQRVRDGQPPVNIGRPDIMAAALDLAPNPDQRLLVIDMMTGFAGAPKPGTTDRISPDHFERSTFAHVLAERMMMDCRINDFERARGLTSAPESVRYALWQARIEGGAGQLAGVVRRGDGTDDTRHVRQALEGIGAILALGYCPQAR